MEGAKPTGSGVRYQILGRLGQGTFGDVDVAFDTVLKRKVALKRIRPELAKNAQLCRRFVTECETLTKLEHQNIVPVYDCGRGPDGRLYFCMRLIEGNGLDERVSEFHDKMRNPPPCEAFETSEFQLLIDHFLAACEATAHAHRHSILHRDIKPANIMVSRYNETYLVDWGMARRLDQEPPKKPEDEPTKFGPTGLPLPNPQVLRTMQGAVLGTPAFMSPEQAIGDIASLDERTDIFSLGTTLFFILTNRTAFDGADTHSILERARFAERYDVREINPSAPVALAKIYRRATEQDPAHRYSNVEQMVEDLRKWKTSMMRPTVEPPPVQKEHLSYKSTPLAMIIAMILFIMSVILGPWLVPPAVDYAWQSLTKYQSISLTVNGQTELE